jgi:hypothetical protein
MSQENGQQVQLHVGHLKNVLVLARHGIAAIGAKLPAHEGKAAFESLGNVEAFIAMFDAAQQAPQQAPQQPDDFQIHTIKIE